MKFNPNEKRYVEKMINEEKVFNIRYPKNDVRLLLRYFVSIGMSENDSIFNTIQFMNRISNEKKDWSIDVNKCYKELSKKTLLTKPLSNVMSIEITRDEMCSIESLKNENLEKVAFGLLVYCKIWRKINNKNDSCWVRIDNTTDFYRDVQVSVCAKDREMNIHKLLIHGLIDIPRKTGSTDIKLNFVNDNSDIVITINSIENFIFDYYIYKGKKVISCKECGERILVKGRSRTQYCSPCKKEKELEQDRIYQQNKYKNAKNPNIS